MNTIGVASVSIVPLRAKASDASEQTSQILGGEGVSLLEEGRGDWVKIKSLEDGYVGWCDKKQIMFGVKIPEERTMLCHPMSQWNNERTLAALWMPAGALIEEREDAYFLGADKITPFNPDRLKDDVFGAIPLTLRAVSYTHLTLPTILRV